MFRVTLGSKFTGLNDSARQELERKLRAAGARVEDLRFESGRLFVTVSVDASSEDDAVRQALAAAESFASGPGAGWTFMSV